jgi:hypothetical protein
MSLRPDVSGFNLKRLTSLFGCRDESIASKLEENFNSLIISNSQALEQGRKLIRSIIFRGYEQVLPQAENEVLQIVINCMAWYNQEHNCSESDFWESLMCELDNEEFRPRSDMQRLFKFLLNGRPFFGLVTRSNWSYYAYLTNQETEQILAYLQTVQKFREDDEFALASAWMQEMVADGQDIWYYAS